MQLINTVLNYRKNENINHMNTKSPQNFLTYFDVPIKKATYHDFPENCAHVRMSYYIWDKEGKSAKDPTSIGRKIKKMSVMVR